jgi:hypothetical protein
MASRCNQARFCKFLRAVLIAAAFVLLGSASAYGQIKPVPTPPPPEPTSGPSKPDSSSTDFGSPESEMKAKLALKEEKKQYDENVARAREAADLANQLAGVYETKQAFNAADSKKLERLEKLTKRIRNEAGGSETDPDVKEIPTAMNAAVKRVAELADALRKLVESTPRHVISASVIDEANKLLGVIQHVRYGRQ